MNNNTSEFYFRNVAISVHTIFKVSVLVLCLLVCTGEQAFNESISAGKSYLYPGALMRRPPEAGWSVWTRSPLGNKASHRLSQWSLNSHSEESQSLACDQTTYAEKHYTKWDIRLILNIGYVHSISLGPMHDAIHSKRSMLLVYV